MIGVHGRGIGAPIEIRKTVAFDIPREIVDSFDELQSALSEQDKKEAVIPVRLALHVSKELACIEEEAISEIIAESKLKDSDVLAVGVHDPGLRVHTSRQSSNGVPEGIFYQGLCDASYLAEQTGMNIVDAFPARDIAVKGNGRPIFPLPAWIFLKSELKNRILIDLGRSARLTFLPQAENPFSHQKIQHIEVCPCGTLLDTLVWQLTGGKTTLDSGGRMAVQGRQNPDLMTALRKAEKADTETKKKNGTITEVKPDIYIKIADNAAQNGLSPQDVLCTVSGFIAEKVAEQALQWTKGSEYLEPELLIQGSGQKHGLLMNSLMTHISASKTKPKRTLTPIAQLGIPVDTFDALCTAMLSLLAVDHIPGNLPHLTGGETTKALGRLTQGATANWHRLLGEISDRAHTNRTMRSAG